jgi:hypothetical protein
MVRLLNLALKQNKQEPTLCQNDRSKQFLCRFTGARGTELSPPFFKLSVYIFIFNRISLLFHLFYLILTCSCPYSYNLMLTPTYMCRFYIYTNYPKGKKLRKFKNRTTALFGYI